MALQPKQGEVVSAPPSRFGSLRTCRTKPPRSQNSHEVVRSSSREHVNEEARTRRFAVLRCGRDRQRVRGQLREAYQHRRRFGRPGCERGRRWGGGRERCRRSSRYGRRVGNGRDHALPTGWRALHELRGVLLCRVQCRVLPADRSRCGVMQICGLVVRLSVGLLLARVLRRHVRRSGGRGLRHRGAAVSEQWAVL